MGLKLAKLPDRTPVKLTIILPPELNLALQDYAEAYARAYGEPIAIADLAPAILERFLAADRSFARERKRTRPDANALQ